MVLETGSEKCFYKRFRQQSLAV